MRRRAGSANVAMSMGATWESSINIEGGSRVVVVSRAAVIPISFNIRSHSPGPSFYHRESLHGERGGKKRRGE